jgi:hypothetical protein
MKSGISLFLFAAVFSSVFWMACDKVDEPLRIVDQRTYPINPDDTLFFVDSVFVQVKQVMLEDFTGHRCVNCPTAAVLLNGMLEELHPRLVSYTVHAGNFANPVPNSPFETDLRSPLSERLFSDYGIFANPIGMIDRIEFNGLIQIFTDSWQSVVTQQLQNLNSADLKLKNTFYPKTNTVLVDANIDFLADLDGNYHLVVYLVEDGIVSPHLNNNPSVGPDTLWNFKHHNVLRAAVNAAYGERLNITEDIVSGQSFSKSYTFQLDEAWVASNCNIIAYIGKYDDVLNLLDIIQVAELGIKTE